MLFITKKYLFLILKLVWYGFLASWGSGILFFYIIYKILFSVSKAADKFIKSINKWKGSEK